MCDTSTPLRPPRLPLAAASPLAPSSRASSHASSGKLVLAGGCKLEIGGPASDSIASRLGKKQSTPAGGSPSSGPPTRNNLRPGARPAFGPSAGAKLSNRSSPGVAQGSSGGVAQGSSSRAPLTPTSRSVRWHPSTKRTAPKRDNKASSSIDLSVTGQTHRAYKDASSAVLFRKPPQRPPEDGALLITEPNAALPKAWLQEQISLTQAMLGAYGSAGAGAGSKSKQAGRSDRGGGVRIKQTTLQEEAEGRAGVSIRSDSKHPRRTQRGATWPALLHKQLCPLLLTRH